MILNIVGSILFGLIGILLLLRSIFDIIEVIFNVHIPVKRRFEAAAEMMASFICFYIAIKFFPYGNL